MSEFVRDFRPTNEYIDNRFKLPSNITIYEQEDYTEVYKNTPNFTPQYSDLYRVRLSELEVEFRRPMKDGTQVEELSRMREKEDCYVIGCVFKLMKSRKSYVKSIEEGETLKLITDFDDLLPCEEDEVFLENNSGKRMLNLAQAVMRLDGHAEPMKVDIKNLISGMIVRMLCYLESQNEIIVKEIELPGICQPIEIVENPYIAENDSPGLEKLILEKNVPRRLVAVVSGLEINSFTDNFSSMQLMKDFLSGKLSSELATKFLKNISTVIFAGNFLESDRSLNKQLLRSYQYKQEKVDLMKNINESMRIADDLVANLCERYSVIVLPGENDLSDTFLPQRPFPEFCFPEAHKRNANIAFASNPALLRVGGKDLLLVDGVNMNYLLELTPGLKTELEVLEMTLNARHVAPNSPESFPCYPSKSKDPLIIDKPCDFYVCGSAQSYQSKIVRSGSAVVKLLCVPSFKKTNSIVLLDIETYESFEFTFNAGS